MTIQEKTSFIEKTFEDFLTHKTNEETFCKELGVVLSSLHRYRYAVGISNQNKKETFYGMRIFPAFDNNSGTDLYGTEVNRMLGVIEERISFEGCYQSWVSNTNWYIEIDAATLDNRQINLNPRELTAMVLHEIGHVVYSSKPLERVYNAFMDMKAMQNTGTKAKMRFTTFLFYPVVVSACKYRSWVVGKDEKNVEIFADKNVVEYGYGEDLVSAFGKVIKFFGRTDSDAKSVESEMTWSTNLVQSLSERRNNAEKIIYIKSAQTSSSFIQSIYKRMLTKMGFLPRNKYTGEVLTELPAVESLFNDTFIKDFDIVKDDDVSLALERMLNVADQKQTSAMESFGSRKQKPDEIDELQYDIDKILIDADKITSHHDRIYVLDQIYNAKEKLGEWEERLREFPNLRPKYGEKVNRMLDEINSLRGVVLSKKNFDKRYEVFVKYPVGYEG